MTRGTTVILNFDLGTLSASTIDVASIAFKQGKEVVLEKGLDDCTIPSTYKLSLALSQADTLLFDSRVPLLVQLRLKVGTTAMASQVMGLDVKQILKEGEI